MIGSVCTAKIWERMDLSPGTLAPKSGALNDTVNIYGGVTATIVVEKLPCSSARPSSFSFVHIIPCDHYPAL